MSRKHKIYRIILALSVYIIGIFACSVYFYRFETGNIIGNLDRINRTGAKALKHILIDGQSKNTEKLSKYARDLKIDRICTGIIKNGQVSITDSNIKDSKFSSELQKHLEQSFETGKDKSFTYSDTSGKYRCFYLPTKEINGSTYFICTQSGINKLQSKFNGILVKIILVALIFILLALPLLLVFKGIEQHQVGMLKEKQAQLAHAGRLTAMGEMAAGIAHEINQPLCVVRGYLELLQAVLKDNPVLKEKKLDQAFDIGIKSVDKASRIINHMRSFVRTKNLEIKSVHLQEPVEEGMAFFHEQIRLHNIDLKKEFEENLPEVKIDPQRFEQIVVNFISNARHAVDKKGEKLGRGYKKQITIRLFLNKKTNMVTFEIQDNADGMPADILEHCTEPFFTTKEAGEGTGLGLSIVYGIIEEFGGKMDINSKVGEGSTFRVSFPAVSE
jgi:signal transduction histidine kinase